MIKDMWVVEIGRGSDTYYSSSHFKGGTYVLEDAELHESNPNPLAGKAIKVRVTTVVELIE